jgi:hypothetical protein
MLSEYAEAGAKWLLTGATILARTVAQSRIHNREIADRQSRDVAADGVDYTRCVGTEDPRRNDPDTGQAADHEQIEMVERGGANADANIAGAEHIGYRQIVATFNAIQTAVARDRECLHWEG